MSILSRLARAASSYVKGRMATAPSRARTRGGRPPISANEVRRRSRPGPPPIQPDFGGSGGSKPPTGNAPTGGDDDEFDDIELLGRDYSYDAEDMQLLDTKMRLVSSSNVYSFAFQSETPTMGILYVTFLEYTPKDAGGSGKRGKGPGATYAYYNFPLAKFKQFEMMANSTAGGAVWDYCRVRHSVYEHQHTYRLISVSGEYVPRKVTARGFVSRSLPDVGIGGRGARRSTLLPQRNPKPFRRQLPRRSFAGNGSPNRGAPNRGRPNRG